MSTTTINFKFTPEYCRKNNVAIYVQNQEELNNLEELNCIGFIPYNIDFPYFTIPITTTWDDISWEDTDSSNWFIEEKFEKVKAEDVIFAANPPANWTVKATNKEEEKAINAYARTIGGDHWTDEKNFAHTHYLQVENGKYSRGWPHEQEGYTNITFNQFKILTNMNTDTKEIIGYKCPSDLYGGAIKAKEIYKKCLNPDFYEPTTIDNDSVVLPKEIVETWEPVYEEEFKVGDWIYITNTRSAVATYSQYGASVGDVEQIKRIAAEGGNATIDDPRYFGDNFNLRGEGFRKATEQEILDAKSVELYGYSAKKTENGVKFGCQSFTKDELLFVKRLVTSTKINGTLSIHETVVTKDLINKLIRLSEA